MDRFDWTINDREGSLRRYWTETDMTMSDIGAVLGTTRGSVAKRISMLKLPRRRPPSLADRLATPAAPKPVLWREGESSLPPLWSQMRPEERAEYAARWGGDHE